MSSQRQAALSVLVHTCGVKHVLVDAQNLKDWVLDDDPLHPAYPALSSTHKSDYLRSYFMYHYGGGYADIKPLAFDWTRAYTALDDAEVDFFGSPEQKPEHVVGSREMQLHFRRFASNCAFIFKPKTAFANEWKTRVDSVLDAKLESIQTHPGTYHPRAIRQGVHGYKWRLWQRIPRGYPLEWNEIMGRVFHQLQWERPGSYELTIPRLAFGSYR